MTHPGQLSPEARELVRDIVAGLSGPDRHRERAGVQPRGPQG
jgi:hypothetical protein